MSGKTAGGSRTEATSETTTIGAYLVRADGAEERIGAATLDEARALAEEWLREGIVDAVETDLRTSWADGTLTDPDGEIEQLSVQVDPEEPGCTERTGHQWAQVKGSLWGHGGGVEYTELCGRCLLLRDTDTWAQRPDTGEQGLRSVTYRRTEED